MLSFKIHSGYQDGLLYPWHQVMTLQVVLPESHQAPTSFVVNCLRFKGWVPSCFQRLMNHAALEMEGVLLVGSAGTREDMEPEVGSAGGIRD